jgi:hypothetical protein
MKPFRRTPYSKIATLAVVATALSACASQAPVRPRAPRGGDDSGVVLASSSWLNGTLGGSPAERPVTGNCAVRTNCALQPTDPWLGTVGVRSLLGDSCEAGMGLCVPNPFPSSSSRATSPATVDRVRDVGVGVWLKLDF